VIDSIQLFFRLALKRERAMEIEASLPLLEEILGRWDKELGKDGPGYKHHVYRIVHFCLALRECNAEDREKIVIAGCFHDLGIWASGTIDYLPPSIALAKAYLAQTGRKAWTNEIELMIDMHHKLRQYRNDRYPLVELFRRADLVDVSLGLLKWGLPGNYVKNVKARFPNAGFHKRLTQLAGLCFARHPLSPPPFMKW